MALRCKDAKLQLVDCYLAMARLRRFPTALFVIRECKDSGKMNDLEGDLIREHAATNMNHGLNCKQSQSKKL